jgi:hypothetical protein
MINGLRVDLAFETSSKSSPPLSSSKTIICNDEFFLIKLVESLVIVNVSINLMMVGWSIDCGEWMDAKSG